MSLGRRTRVCDERTAPQIEELFLLSGGQILPSSEENSMLKELSLTMPDHQHEMGECGNMVYPHSMSMTSTSPSRSEIVERRLVGQELFRRYFV
jgi:hypothetical protein